jgi:parallel beta-helix repeat protein
MESSNDNTISGNNITVNTRSGIMLYGYSNNNSISGNNVANSFDGIYLDGSNNDISENNITASYRCGIRLYYSPGNNSVSRNYIAKNQYGIGLEGSSGNMFYHNNFINNINQVYSSDSVNVWDDGYPCGGNYWSDYNGTDPDYDGVGDTSYFIDANNQDDYSLMGMFFCFNTSCGGAVDFVSNSSISGVSFNLSNIAVYPPEAILAFNVSGEADSEGFLRVCIPKILINGSYVVRFDDEIITNTTYPQVRELPCSNETHLYLYINYTHSEHAIIITGTAIIPEFLSGLVMVSLLVFVSIALMIVKRRKCGIRIREVEEY